MSTRLYPLIVQNLQAIRLIIERNQNNAQPDAIASITDLIDFFKEPQPNLTQYQVYAGKFEQHTKLDGSISNRNYKYISNVYYSFEEAMLDADRSPGYAFIEIEVTRFNNHGISISRHIIDWTSTAKSR